MSDDDSPWMKMSDEDKSNTPEFEPISPDYSFDKPPGEKDGEPESLAPTGGPPQEISNLSPSPSKNSEAVQAAVVRYYKLKGDYDAKYKNAKNKITKSDLSLSEMRKKIKSMKMKCINCKQNGGTIFTNKDGILTAKCGNTESPCALDIQIKRGKWMLLTKAADLSEEDIEVSKENIIDLKLDLLFGLRTEEQIASEFDESKRDYKSLVKQLDMINGVIESENTIKIGAPTKDEDSVRNIPIKEYLNIKNRQLTQLVTRFKSLVKEYMEEDEVLAKQDLMQQAINIYTEQIFPIMTNIRESKYAVTMMDKTEERGMFIMKQVKTLLQNLDFEYEFGEIISDKK
jgi:hypothetical protein